MSMYTENELKTNVIRLGRVKIIRNNQYYGMEGKAICITPSQVTVFLDTKELIECFHDDIRMLK